LPPHLTEPKPDSPATMGGTHRLRPHLDGGGGRGACQPPPHLAEPLSDSPAKVGGAHWQAITPRQRGLPVTATPRGAVPGLARDSGRRAPASKHAWMKGCRLSPHRARPFPDSPATLGGAHQQACAGRHHTARSRFCTRPQWWEARTGTAPARSPTAGKPVAKLRAPRRCCPCKNES